MSGAATSVEFAVLLGTYRAPNGQIGRIVLPRGAAEHPTVGTLVWEVLNLRASVPVRMRDSYWPVPIEGFPPRGSVDGGDIAAFPVPESDALVAAGLADAVVLIGGQYVVSPGE